MFPKIISNFISEKNLYFLILLIVVFLFMQKNPDVALMLFASLLFACSLSPLVNKLSKKMNRPLAATLVLVALFIVSCIFILPILYLSAYQITEFAKAFPSFIDNLNQTIASIPMLKYLKITSININALFNSLSSSSANIIEGIATFIGNLSSIFLYIFTAVILLFFFLADEQLVKNNFLKLLPSEIRDKASTLLDTLKEKLGGYVVAQVVVSGSVWITMTIGLLLFKIDYAIVLGLIAGILSLIPVIGSAISLVICMIATYEAGWGPLIIVVVLFTVSHFIENHVVRPYVYSKFLKLHPILIFLSLFVGAKYAGVTGVIFAPPIAMVLCFLLEELYSKKMD